LRPIARSCVLAFTLLATTVLPGLMQPAAAAPTMQVLSRDTIPSGWLKTPAGSPDPSAPWHVGVSVAGRDAPGLKALLRDQYVKASADYQHFLTPAEFAQRFGAVATDTAAVKDWLAAKGLSVTYTNPAGTYLMASGSVAQVEDTFATHLANFTGQAGTPFASYTANTSPPTVPTAVTAVAGLDTLSVAHTSVARPAIFPIPGLYDPKNLWKAYEQPDDNTGQGQRLAAFGWGAPSTIATDLVKFETNNNLPRVPLTVLQVGTPNNTDTAGLVEWDLDSQASTGMAPSAAGMTFYFANSGSSDLLAQAINVWANDAVGAKQASGSYGLCDVFGWLGTFDAHEAALVQAAAEGRSFFASTGDTGSGCTAAGAGLNGVTIGPIPSPEYPSTSPNAIGVGGTVLYTKSDDTRDREIAWTHTGGGFSSFFAMPDYQTDLTPNFTVDGAFRATADVSALSADLVSGYNIVSNGSDTSTGGTSLSAPLWQGMWARINAAAPTATNGTHPGLGFANRLIYPIGQDPTKYAATFTDIVVGANGLYTALPGYDYLTGWGVPRVKGLMLALDGTTTPNLGGGGGGGGGTTGGGAGRGIVGNSDLPPCQPSPQVVDATGDATQLAVADTAQPAANQADLDITNAALNWDDVTSSLVATIHVANLAATPGNSENMRFDFAYAGTTYELTAERDSTGAELYNWSKPGLNASSLGSLTGSFDNARNVVTVILPASAFATAEAATQTLLGVGSGISHLSVLSQRLVGVITATADSAALTADCAYTISSAGPTPVVPEVPFAALLPVLGLLFLGTTVYRRRRRTAPLSL
jgi:pseudomonalisin